MTRAKDIRILSFKELPDWWESRDGDELRACCPVHHGDNPSALKVDLQGEYVGFGYCFACHVVVLVKELNPEATARIARLQQGLPAEAQEELQFELRTRGPAREREPREWQVTEHAALCALYQRMLTALDYSSGWAQAYLLERGVPPTVAQSQGLGYLSRKALEDPALAPYRGLLLRWVNSIVFPLAKLAPPPPGGGPALYSQGFIGRTLAFWRPGEGIDEDEQKRRLDEHNALVLDHNRRVKRGEAEGHYKRSKLRWAKTEPAGWVYQPDLVGALAQLVEGGFDKLALLTAAALFQAQGQYAGFPSGGLIALAGTAARLSLLPFQAQAYLLALDGDQSGLERMVCLREDLRGVGKPAYLCPPPVDVLGKDWSARWRKGGMAGVRQFFEASVYVSAWQDTPVPDQPCLVLVDELVDALAFLATAKALGRCPDPASVMVLTGAELDPARLLPRARAVVYAVGGGLLDEAELDPEQRPHKVCASHRQRMNQLREDLRQSGLRVYDCPPPADGRGRSWNARWRSSGPGGVRLLVDAYDFAQGDLCSVSV
jgi:hypothetical protein